MACNCGKKTCNQCGTGGGNSPADAANMAAQLADLQDSVAEIAHAIRVFKDGHPIILVEHPDDLAQFDLVSGLGFGIWEGWGICNGKQYMNTDLNKMIITPNMNDRVPVGAGGSYLVDDVFGNNLINLTVGQLPAHTHVVDDPGHTHIITDPGHAHPTDDPGHNHAGNNTLVHGAQGTTDSNGDHNHLYASLGDNIHEDTTATGPQVGVWDRASLANTSVNGAHTHTFTVDDFNVMASVQASPCGVTIDDAFTGLSNVDNTTGITLENTGDGDDVDVRQPSLALFFAMKIQ